MNTKTIIGVIYFVAVLVGCGGVTTGDIDAGSDLHGQAGTTGAAGTGSAGSSSLGGTGGEAAGSSGAAGAAGTAGSTAGAAGAAAGAGGSAGVDAAGTAGIAGMDAGIEVGTEASSSGMGGSTGTAGAGGAAGAGGTTGTSSGEANHPTCTAISQPVCVDPSSHGLITNDVCIDGKTKCQLTNGAQGTCTGTYCCAGCMTATGQCVAGTSPTMCGNWGAACAYCSKAQPNCTASVGGRLSCFSQ